MDITHRSHRAAHRRARALATALLLGLAGGAADARAECACLCLDGTYQTVCRSLAAAQATGSLCQARAGRGCPLDDAAGALRQYGAPVDGADNCREARVFDPQTGGHVSARVCDLAR